MRRSQSGSSTELMSGGIIYSPVTRQRQSAYNSPGASASPGALGGAGARMSSAPSYPYGGGGVPGYGSGDGVAEAGVKSLASAREKEKKDMQDLNMRFANYIEKNRFLEAQLKAVEQKLKELQAKWGKETAAVKQMYETELRHARDLYDGAESGKAKGELQIRTLEDQLADLRRKLDDSEKERAQNKNVVNTQIQQLSDYEAELNMLRRRVVNLENDCDGATKDRMRLQDELFRATQERDAERLNSVELDFRLQSVLEELEFLKQVHDQEVKELSVLNQQDNYAQNRKFWEGEMSNAIRDLQKEFDLRTEQNITKQESYYQMKVQEMRTNQVKDNGRVDRLTDETRRLQGAVADQRALIGDLELRNAQLEKQYNELLREHEDDARARDEERARSEADLARLSAECERLLRDVESMMTMKLSLELEIAAYRKLLETEETRLLLADAMGPSAAAPTPRPSAGRGAVALDPALSEEEERKVAATQQSAAAAPSDTPGDSFARSEINQKISFTRSAKGPVAISKCNPSGDWVEIENTGRKTEQIDRWQIGRKVDNEVLPFFTFPADFSIGSTKGSRLVKVYAKGKGPDGALEYSEHSFGMGSVVVTTLLNDQGEIKADHVQKTAFAI